MSYTEKCHNHIYMIDEQPGLPWTYLLFYFPKAFLHNLSCPDNPWLHWKSNEMYERYGKPISYFQRLKLQRRQVEQVTQQKAEQLEV